MADQDDASKTEDPTERKLGKAREKGNVAQSQEIKSWAMLLASTIGLVLMAPGIARDVERISARFIEAPETIPMDFEHLRHVMAATLLEVGWILAPLLLLLMIFAFAGNVGQFGLLWAPSKLELDFSKISIIKGFKNKFSMKAMVELVKGILKIAVVAVVAFGMSVPLLQDITLMPGFDLLVSVGRMFDIAVLLASGTVAVLTVIALLDFAYQKQSFIKEMRMTKQEVKDEHKQMDGDPLIKARIRRIRMERARLRMMAAVPKADVVITNPTHYAVALEYKMDEMAAPRMVAKGVDFLALRIRELAQEHEVPLVENPPLARALYATVELDQEIPPEHYKAVAEIIGYVMRLKGKLPRA